MENNNNIDEYRLKDPSKIKQTSLCAQKIKYMDDIYKNLSKNDAFMHMMDELSNGCDSCCMCSTYGPEKQCPHAQRLIAQFYRDGVFVPKNEKIAHQWENFSARQGYKYAIIKVADDLRDGVGCKQNILKAVEKYKSLAMTRGNEYCTRQVIEIIECSDEIDDSYTLPYIVALANDGDEEMLIKLIKAYQSGDLGLKADLEMTKFWMEKAIELAHLDYYLDLAEIYEKQEDWDAAVKWYIKLSKKNNNDNYKDKIAELERKALKLDLLTPHEIAEKGFKYFYGYGVQENKRLAYVCFSAASRAEDGLGERGKAFCIKDNQFDDIREDRYHFYVSRSARHGNLESIKELYYEYKDTDNDEANNLLKRFKEIAITECKNRDPWALEIVGICFEKGEMNFEMDVEKAFIYYKSAVEHGSIRAMHRVGLCYLNGKGVEKNNDLAFEWFEKAANAGCAQGLYHQAGFLTSRFGKHRDYNKGFIILQQLVERKHSAAFFSLACCYLYGEGISKNISRAYQLFKESAELGCLEAQRKLCVDYFEGKKVEKNLKLSAFWGEKALAQGDKSVMFKVAYASNAINNKKRAIELYTILANNGDIASMNNLACICGDISEEVKWFTKSADAGDSVAQCNIGRYYLLGTGVERNYEKARYYFELSAKQGYAPAIYELGDLYLRGWGVEKDLVIAKEYYEKAAEKGNLDAYVRLARCYKIGTFGEEDYKKSLSCYKKITELSSGNEMVEALYNIGYFFEKGLGVEKNKNSAIFWYRMAANRGSYEAQHELLRLGVNWMDEDGNVTNN